MAGIETLLVFPVTALHLAGVPGGIGTNQFLQGAQPSGSFLIRGVSGLLGIGCPETAPGELVNGGVLEQARLTPYFSAYLIRDRM